MAEHEESTTPENSEDKKRFWQRNGATIITLAILGLIIGGAIAVNEQRASDDFATETIVLEQGEDTDASDTEGGEEVDSEDVQDTGEVASGTTATTVSPRGEVRVENQIFTVSAAPGEGRTHLARRAITEQLRQIDTSLSPEQRVYAEDYLQKNYSPGDNLNPGSTLEFSADQINEAISASQSLTDAQLDNLTQFSDLVNWPPI